MIAKLFSRTPKMPMVGLAHVCSQAWHANRPFFVTMAAYAVAVALAAAYWQIPLDPRIYSEPFLLFGGGVTCILFAIVATRVMLERPERLLPCLVRRLLENDLPNRLVIGLPVALILPVFFSLFTSMKGGLSRIVPFYADSAIIAVDRMIHGGQDAWKILHPLLGAGLLTFALNFLYNLWFVVMLVVLFCVTFSTGDKRLRSQYLVAFVLTWVLLGNAAATIFASVGPAFIIPFYGDDTFSPLMNYLQATNTVYPVWALHAQGVLLANAALDGPRLGSGISAFPSLHVAVATLNAIYLWRFGGVLRWAGVIFLIAIQLGAVHLAWHYAVDGYASMLATPVIWVLARRLSKDPGMAAGGYARSDFDFG
ncbi:MULTISPECIES: phosphatase PAP2 family protein [unclassified Mesorhizobium]|uniref:phosphatase PAP2 family protein n=1 Tax=unclassified Mesorhizobium TaxID=325217 RepID=UPI000FCC9E40|nr:MULTISPECIES: phosphatase PAP2 family protein [unclassified Mesorhizobium]TIT80618.1 MAG: inositol phosphorylceramide synthase [Mesorhizobium sp.]TGP22384.1 inositol phosphorylceramide synthase [Mesorhizobium sp. M1D.F.Ca.ET.231.01.1.1]TGP25952.1 inositol phosphorylceramide synthase [Mesorhizobium sp. M1D.F.Ca.ET.234.01.1.1]TGS40020.1 inositol phosphorylceramide synthase [Mesorhizobium sp. M1D.F.Ca.ET.184.01.1.1]TGS58793.1 inositol phosphorylceramide synthase [Mesorhizobium sp. M1D.F.Ca.ET.